MMVVAPWSQLGNVVDVMDFAIDPHAHHARFADLRDHLAVRPATATDQRRHDHGLGALGQLHQPIQDLLR